MASCLVSQTGGAMGRSSAVPAASNTLAVLRYLAAQAGPVPAAAIGRDLGLPRSSTYHLLSTLVAEGFAVHLPEERRYGLGVSAFELGTAYSRQEPLARLGRPDRKSTRLNSSHVAISYAVFCLKKNDQ